MIVCWENKGSTASNNLVPRIQRVTIKEHENLGST